MIESPCSRIVFAHLKLKIADKDLIGFVDFFADTITIWLIPGLAKISLFDWAEKFAKDIKEINKAIIDGYDLPDREGWLRRIVASLEKKRVVMPRSSYNALENAIRLLSKGRVELERLDTLYLRDS